MSACWQAAAAAAASSPAVSKALSISKQTSQSLFHLHFHRSSSHTRRCLLLLFRASCSPTPTARTAPLKEFSLNQPHSPSQSPQQQQGRDGDDAEEEEEEESGISNIQVPRQKHIPLSKSQLLDAILSIMFNQDQDHGDAYHFRLLTSCLDSILHAEHKSILEEMRSDYYDYYSVQQTQGSLVQNSADSETETQQVGPPNGKESNPVAVTNDIPGIEDGELYQVQQEEPEPLLSNHGLDLRLSCLLRSLDRNSTKVPGSGGSRVNVATRFQRAFMQLLSDAQFEELSASDLMLTSALNTDYLLTLPIYVDWKRAYESNAIIFSYFFVLITCCSIFWVTFQMNILLKSLGGRIGNERGYATEKQKGLLIVEKLDYLQSKLLRRIFFIISKPLGKLGTWISKINENVSEKQKGNSLIERLRLWLKGLTLFQKSLAYNEHDPDEQIGSTTNHLPGPIWLAAQRAVARYEGILSPVGPRERLLRRLFSWIGFIPSKSEAPLEVDNASNTPEPYLRPTFLSRISLSDIWRPATAKYCRNDPWKMLKTSISILFSQSVLQEPAFEELILLYTKEVGETNSRDRDEVPSLQLKIYERIPIPDLPVIFPHKKLSFRIIDTVRLDIATILGLLAYFINYKFENVLSSPSAILLDVVAISALIIYGSRVVLGYKQTWDRYQLLVNKTLYEKTLASGFGSVHFLLDASEQQQYKEAILAYAVLLKAAEKGQVTSRQSVGEKCERFMYEVFKVKVEMPIDKALNTLLRLSLATETCIDGKHGLLATPCPKAYHALKHRWNALLN